MKILSFCKSSKFVVCLLLAAAMLFSAVSCVTTVKAQELSKDYQRTATEEGSVTNDLKQALANFSFELFHRTVTEDSQNDLLSPLSAYLCLAMIANGADEETLAQMNELLGLSAEQRNKDLYAYVAGLYSGKNCKVSLANSIWFRNEEHRLHVKEEFLQTNADWFGADIYSANFDDSTLQDINNWVKDKTEGMIDKILNEIPEGVVMYLINSLLFDAKWQTPYEKDDIRDAKFQNGDSTLADVQMMYSMESTYLTYHNEKLSAQGFARNYESGKYSFVALLPDDSSAESVYELTRALNGEDWLAMWEARKSASVYTGIPEFSYDSYLELKDMLTDMGMTDAFDGNLANLHNLGYSERGNLYVSLVDQKNIIDVSRNGTKAAAITIGGISDECAAVEIETYSVILDRPFVYAIVDNATGLPLFLGLVTRLS